MSTDDTSLDHAIARWVAAIPVSLMGGQKVKTRVTVKQISPSEQTFLMEMQGADGKWMPMMESKGKKTT